MQYTDAVPTDYEPEYFQAGSDEMLRFSANTSPIRIKIGTLNTEHHDVALKFVGLESLLYDDLCRMDSPNVSNQTLPPLSAAKGANTKAKTSSSSTVDETPTPTPSIQPVFRGNAATKTAHKSMSNHDHGNDNDNNANEDAISIQNSRKIHFANEVKSIQHAPTTVITVTHESSNEIITGHQNDNENGCIVESVSGNKRRERSVVDEMSSMHIEETTTTRKQVSSQQGKKHLIMAASNAKDTTAHTDNTNTSNTNAMDQIVAYL